MDKVRAFMKVAWLQRFWILSVVGTLAAVVCWMMASGKLQAEFATNKASIEGKFGDMSAISLKQIHGNAGVNAKEREEAKKIADSVKALWQKLFEAQREEVLKWPEKQLGADFVLEIDKKKFDAPISQQMRDRYLNYIKNRFDGLLEIADAKKLFVEPTEFGATTGMRNEGGAGTGEAVAYGPDGMPMIEEDFLVQWADQDRVRLQLEFPSVPTSRQIWVTQEDLWVYETLLRAIANTNKERGATRPDNTAIRVIQSLEVGAQAALAMSTESTILMPVDAAGGEPPMLDPGMPPATEGAGGAESMDAMLLMNRYIDAEGKPIADASAGAGTEFRRLPIRMVLMMDDRWLPKVLVECANAPLPIEVQRLRINGEKSGTDKDNQPFDLTAGAGAAPGGMGGGGGMGYGRPMGGGESRGGMGYGRPMGGGGGYGRPMGGGGGEMGMTLNPADVAHLATVEIEGLVYIYNPPDAATLTVPGDDATLAAGDASVVR